MVYLNSRDIKLITSVITVAEYLVFPYRENVPQKVQSFFSFIEDNDIDIFKINNDRFKSHVKKLS